MYQVDRLIIYCFTSRSRIFHSYGDVNITSERLQNLGLCSALRAYEQGGIFIVQHPRWHRTSVFPVSSEGPPHLIIIYDSQRGWPNLTRIHTGPHIVASYDTQRDFEDLFLPGPSWVNVSRVGFLLYELGQTWSMIKYVNHLIFLTSS
jgi:hypothetical protein